jgi:hypothetical protein
MSLHTDEQFLAAVAAALGESMALIRRRGFHLEFPAADDDYRPARPLSQRAADPDDDVVDLAALGVDWDADDDCRLRRRRRATVRRSHRKAA